MKERSYYKSRGKAAFKRNYWVCVIVTLILVLISSGSGGRSNGSDDNNYTQSQITNEEGKTIALDEFVSGSNNSLGGAITESVQNEVTKQFVPVPGVDILRSYFTLPVILLGGTALILLSIFIFEVILVGGMKFFIVNSEEKAGMGLLLSSFTNGSYMNTVVTMFVKNIKTFLWTLLFIIPGIVKSYEYRMIPYILADYPEMDRKEVFNASKEMMRGNKLGAFVLDLSFIGWHILSALTLGFLGILWVNPYVYATDAELYIDLKNQYFGAPQASYESYESEAKPEGEGWIETNY